MHCLNGIRALSIIWVLFGHVYLLKIYGPLINAAEIKDWISNISSMILLSATITVDSFFLLSGLLVARAILNELDKR